MQFLKWLLWMFVIAFVGIVLVGFMLPREISATRSVTIDVPAELVFAEINTPRQAKDWVPWGNLDDNTIYQFSGPEQGFEAKMKWENPKFRDYGRGLQTIVVSQKNRLVASELNLDKMGNARAEFALSEAAGGTQVSATFSTQLGHSPFGRWVGLLLDDWLAEDLDKAMAKLKVKLENAPPAAAGEPVGLPSPPVDLVPMGAAMPGQ